MDEMKDLAVIVPCYNTERFVSKLLDSLFEQELGAYKVDYVFVMNNCTDDTERIVRAHPLDCTILQCEEKGCGLARNVGIENSDSKYIWFMDSDDWLLSNQAIKTVLDQAYGLNKPMIRIPFTSTFPGHFSMVWQYILEREFIGVTRFRKLQPAEDNEFTNECLNKLGLTWNRYKELPSISSPQYHYNYMREGSNMFRYALGEDINQ